MADEKTKSNAHAIVNISFDTETRGVVLSINGVVVPSSNVFFEKFVVDGDQHVVFSYTVETANDNGLEERRQFFLPAKAEVGIDVDERGFASKILNNDEKAKADIINYMKNKRS